MKKIVFAAAMSLLGLTSAAQAAGCDSPFCQGSGKGLFGGGGGPLPAFQAAPWYLYWPYNQHFMTPSPMQGAYSAPPYHGGGLVNPYFPGGGYGYGAPPVSGAGSIYNPPTQMPGVTPAPGTLPPVTPAPTATPPVTPAPGATPPVTPGVRVIPAGPSVIRASWRR
jgi:hypothetical protein